MFIMVIIIVQQFKRFNATFVQKVLPATPWLTL